MIALFAQIRRFGFGAFGGLREPLYLLVRDRDLSFGLAQRFLEPIDLFAGLGPERAASVLAAGGAFLRLLVALPRGLCIGLSAGERALEALDLRVTGKRGGLGAFDTRKSLLRRPLGSGQGLRRLLGLAFEPFDLEGRLGPGVIDILPRVCFTA